MKRIKVLHVTGWKGKKAVKKSIQVGKQFDDLTLKKSFLDRFDSITIEKE